MKVVIIGAGNVATVLGKKIKAAGFVIEQVISKNIQNARALAGILGASAQDDISRVSTKGDLYLIATLDSVIKQIAEALQVWDKVVIHTAGSVSINVLQHTGGSYGVLYPVQSLRKEMETTPAIPVMIDADNAATLDKLYGFADTWAAGIHVANDEKRMKTHVAAVIASNFTNYLYALTERYCVNENLDFTSLLPLINEVAGRLAQYSPAVVQTGPAARGDQLTIKQHMDILAAYPVLQKVYSFMTEGIIYGTNRL